MRAQSGSLQIYYPARGPKGELRLLASRGFDTDAEELWESVQIDSRSTPAQALRTGRRAIAEDIEKCDFMAGTSGQAALPRSWIRAAQSTPLVSRGGHVVGMISTYWAQPHRPTQRDFRLLDILARQAADLNERKMSEQELRESEERFRVFTQATFDVIYRMNSDWTEMRYLRGREFISDTPVPSHKWIDKYILPEDKQFLMDTIGRAVRSKSVFELEHRVILVDGAIGWAHSRAIPILDSQGEIVEWFGAARDVSDRKRAEETQNLLVNELNHRVKNTLAIVQAIARQTSTRTRDPSEFVESFNGRIQSLARAQTLLSSTTSQVVELRELIRDQLLSGPVEESRLTASGPVVRLDPQLALYIALMLHELGTNATKYGALSVVAGSVTIDWTTDDALHIRWVERGGPQTTTPSKRGFGSTLIQQSAKGQGGDASMLCEAGGITWNITLPLRDHADFGNGSKNRAATTSQLGSTAAGRETPSLFGRRFLVIEDEPLIGLDIVDALEQAQAHVEGPVSTAEKAFEIIERIPLDGVLLDANLYGRPVDDFAAALIRRNVPFVFVTGQGSDDLSKSFPGARVLSKPCSHQQIVKAAAQLITPRSDVVRLRR